MITLDEVRLHLRLDSDYFDEDTLLEGLISASMSSIEYQTERAINSRTETLILDNWLAVIELPWWPVQTVDSVRYTDPDSVEQSITDYILDNRWYPAKLKPAPGTNWPAVLAEERVITIEATVGMTELPSDLKQAALLMIGHFYENREAVASGPAPHTMPMAVQYLIEPYKILRFG